MRVGKACFRQPRPSGGLHRTSGIHDTGVERHEGRVTTTTLSLEVRVGPLRNARGGSWTVAPITASPAGLMAIAFPCSAGLLVRPRPPHPRPCRRARAAEKKRIVLAGGWQLRRSEVKKARSRSSGPQARNRSRKAERVKLIIRDARVESSRTPGISGVARAPEKLAGDDCGSREHRPSACEAPQDCAAFRV